MIIASNFPANKKGYKQYLSAFGITIKQGDTDFFALSFDAFMALDRDNRTAVEIAKDEMERAIKRLNFSNATFADAPKLENFFNFCSAIAGMEDKVEGFTAEEIRRAGLYMAKRYYQSKCDAFPYDLIMAKL